MTNKIIYNPSQLDHSVPFDHPENSGRVEAICEDINREIEQSLAASLNPVSSQNLEPLHLIHSENYVKQIELMQPKQGVVYADDDTMVTNGTFLAAVESANLGVYGVDQLADSNNEHIMCLTRPPGHHAFAGKANGFCLFNNVAIAAKYAQTKGFKKIAIIDFDVHQCNGTVDILKNESDIGIYSSFQHPWFPFSHVKEEENLFNLPLNSGTESLEYRKRFEQVFYNKISTFRPDLIIVSAGFDAHQADPLSEINLTDEDYFWLGQFIKDLANTYTGGRVISCLEGGYNQRVLGGSVVSYLEGITS